MITPTRLLLRARRVLHTWQARRLLARANRHLARASGQLARAERHLTLPAPQPGYDELKCPAFVGVMLAACVVLLVDVQDAWPALLGLVNLAGA